MFRHERTVTRALRLAHAFVTVRAVKRYRQQMIFGGRVVPPPEKASEDEVLAFVRGNPNASGYVLASTTLGDGVKTVNVAP